MPIQELVHAFATNPYFTAGAGLIGVGTGVAAARQAWRVGVNYFRRNYLISLEIPSKDKSYAWFMDWMGQKGHHTLQTSVETTYIQYENGEISTKISLVPSTGTHFIWYNGRFIKVDRTREKNVVDLTSGSLWETITLTTLGRDRRLFEQMLNEARNLAVQKEEGSTVIYTTAGSEWRRFGFPRKKRPVSSVILAANKTERITDDVKEFLSSMKWYSERGTYFMSKDHS